MKREELLKNTGYWLAKIQIDLYNQVNEYMYLSKFLKSELPSKLNVSASCIDDIMNGDFDGSLSTLVSISMAIGKVPMINFDDLENIKT